jgi:uncharacterized membrane protein
MILYAVRDVRHWLLGVMIALVVLGAAAATSYVALNYFYGRAYVTTTTQTVIIENSGQQLTINNTRYTVENAEIFVDADNENYYQLRFSISASESYVGAPAVPNSPAPSASGTYGWQGDSYYTDQSIRLPASAYEQAQTTGEPVTVSNTTTTETRPIDALPIATSIGIATGVAVFAIWIGYRQAWGDATSTLLKQGLHDMTVRDIEIVGYIIQRGEFTIPELMKLTNASKITVWRTVQKLAAEGLVVQTKQTKPAANGLGGRGKPSQIYKYVGEKSRQKNQSSTGASSEPKQVP